MRCISRRQYCFGQESGTKRCVYEHSTVRTERQDLSTFRQTKMPLVDKHVQSLKMELIASISELSKSQGNGDKGKDEDKDKGKDEGKDKGKDEGKDKVKVEQLINDRAKIWHLVADDFPFNIRLIEDKLSLLLQAAYKSRHRLSVNDGANEAYWRHDHDRLLFDFFVRESKMIRESLLEPERIVEDPSAHPLYAFL